MAIFLSENTKIAVKVKDRRQMSPEAVSVLRFAVARIPTNVHHDDDDNSQSVVFFSFFCAGSRYTDRETDRQTDRRGQEGNITCFAKHSYIVQVISYELAFCRLTLDSSDRARFFRRQCRGL